MCLLHHLFIFLWSTDTWIFLYFTYNLILYFLFKLLKFWSLITLSVGFYVFFDIPLSLWAFCLYSTSLSYLLALKDQMLQAHLVSFTVLNPRISHFSQEYWFPTLENSTGHHCLDYKCALCYWGFVSWPSQMTKPGNKCMYVNLCISMNISKCSYSYLCIYIYIYIGYMYIYIKLNMNIH